MYGTSWSALSTTDILAAYAAIVSTVAASFEAVRFRRERLCVQLTAAISPRYAGDFEGDLDPQVMWHIFVEVTNIGGVRVVIERPEFVVFANPLMRWFRKSRDTFVVHSWKNIDLDVGKIAEMDLKLSDQDYKKFSSGNALWLAIQHSHSLRPLVVKLPLHRTLTAYDRSRMWSSYNGDYSEEQEQTLERIAMKQRAQVKIRKSSSA